MPTRVASNNLLLPYMVLILQYMPTNVACNYLELPSRAGNIKLSPNRSDKLLLFTTIDGINIAVYTNKCSR